MTPLVRQQAFHEAPGIEHLQILDSLADTCEADRNAQFPLDGDDGTPLGGSVQLGDHETGERQRRGERFALLQGILPDGSVEYQQPLVRRARPLLA